MARTDDVGSDGWKDVSIFISLFLYLCQFISYLFIYLSICPPVSIAPYLYIYLTNYLCQFIYLYIYLSIYLPIHQNHLVLCTHFCKLSISVSMDYPPPQQRQRAVYPSSHTAVTQARENRTYLTHHTIPLAHTIRAGLNGTPRIEPTTTTTTSAPTS